MAAEETVRSKVLRYVKPIHRKLRGQKTDLFPEATVKSMGFPVLGNNLAAFYRRGAEA
jgi:hypothetical protein